MRAMRNFLLVLFAIIFVGNFALFGACIMSGDKNSMACWLISVRKLIETSLSLAASHEISSRA
jgi:hypothetical protein